MITSNLELSWSSRWGARKQVAREATPPVRQLVPSCWSRPITPDMVTQDVTFTADGWDPVTIHITRFEAGGPPLRFHGYTVSGPRQHVTGEYDPWTEENHVRLLIT